MQKLGDGFAKSNDLTHTCALVSSDGNEARWVWGCVLHPHPHLKHYPSSPLYPYLKKAGDVDSPWRDNTPFSLHPHLKRVGDGESSW